MAAKMGNRYRSYTIFSLAQFRKKSYLYKSFQGVENGVAG